ncbi:MAG: prepilin peptidase [Planctomycetota bacterium]
MKAEQLMICWGVAMWIAAAASIFDLRRRRIPNRLVVIAGLTGLIARGLLQGGEGLLQSSLGLLAGAAWWWPFWYRRWVGAGDLKLLAAIGTWVGPATTLPVFVLSAQMLGAVELVRRALRRSWKRIPVAPVMLVALILLSGVQQWIQFLR